MATERNALKEKAAAQGGKPSASERQHYVDSNQMLKGVDRITAMLSDPALAKKIDDQQLGRVLSESISSPALQELLVRPNLDPDVKKFMTEVSVLRNAYYLDQSGKAVTGGEALRNFGAVVQPQDKVADIINKMSIAKERATEKMKDYETYFPSLAAIRGGAKGGAGNAPPPPAGFEVLN